MSNYPRIEMAICILIAAACLILAGVLGYEAVMETSLKGRIIQFSLSLGALAMAAIVGIPSWKTALATGLSRLKVKAGAAGVEVDVGEGVQPVVTKPEKIPEISGAVVIQAASLEKKLDETVIRELMDKEDVMVLWRLAVTKTEKGETLYARRIVDIALEKHRDHPRLLVLSGWLNRQADNIALAIEQSEAAIRAADAKPEFAEVLYVAQSNLAFALALRAELRDKTRALQCAKAAADQFSNFANRHSWLINFGYSQYRFASSQEEIIGAIEYLTKIAKREDLEAGERTEVAKYLSEATEQLAKNYGMSK
jgi:hypothetical protein